MTKEEFYEAVTVHLTVTTLELEKNEDWFIKLIDSLYDLCPSVDPKIAAAFAQDCYVKDRRYWVEYPEFTTNHDGD